MNLDDEVWLKKFNTKKSKLSQCSEDQFEEVMNFFEQTSLLKQPFANVDNAPVLSYADMEAAFDETIEDVSRRFAKDIYEHWKSRREQDSNQPLMPTLKFERNQGTEEDSDPYVCFRRREIRQTRKTRGRDAQITEKLKKMRHELEQARQLLATVKQREILRRDQLQMEKTLFLKRCEVKETKRNLNIKDDDEDLITQKVCDETDTFDQQRREAAYAAFCAIPDLDFILDDLLLFKAMALNVGNDPHLSSLIQQLEARLTISAANPQAETEIGYSNHVPRTTGHGAQDTSRKRRRSSSGSPPPAARRRKGPEGSRNQPHDPRINDETSCLEYRLGGQHMAADYPTP